MLFSRRDKLKAHHRVREFLWPRIGWRRAGRYVAHRVRRMPGTPYAIAAGFASGAAVSMTPFPGFHFILAGLLAWALRGSIVASAIGTVVGNPWTFPFIWLWIFELGNGLLGSHSHIVGSEITMAFLIDHPWQVLFPMLVGAVPTGAVTWFLFYWPIKRMVASHQKHRRHRLMLAKAAGVRPVPANESGGRE